MSIYKILDIVDVPLAYMGSISLLAIKEDLGYVALVLTIGYSTWKWSTEIIDRWNKNHPKPKTKTKSK